MFINFRIKTRLLSLYRKNRTFYYVISTLNVISTKCVSRYTGVSCPLKMRFGNDLLADVILSQFSDGASREFPKSNSVMSSYEIGTT